VVDLKPKSLEPMFETALENKPKKLSIKSSKNTSVKTSVEFKPDPDFLAKINANMRQNNAKYVPVKEESDNEEPTNNEERMQ